MLTFISYCILLLQAVDHPSYGLTAYDCGLDARLIGTFSVDVEPRCQQLRVEDVTSRKLQIIQERQWRRTPIMRCRITMAYVIFHCGFDSINYMAASKLDGEVINIDRMACKTAIKQGYLVTPYGDKRIVGLLPNTAGSYDVDLMGMTYPSGRCKRAAFNFKGIDYNSHVLKATFSILISNEEGTINNLNDVIKFDSGLTATYDETSYFDVRFGNYFWDITDINCLVDSYDVLYEGQANITILHDDEKIINIEQDDFALHAKLRASTRACGYVAFETSVEGLLVVYQSEGVYQFEKVDVDPLNVDLTRHMNSKLGYLLSKSTKQDNSVFLEIAKDICLLEYRQARMAIEILMAFPDAQVKLPGMPKGSIAKIMGEVIFVYQCIPVQVHATIFKKCIQEIPVLYENKTVFLRPFSRIISSEFSEVPCSNEMSPTFFLGGSWRRYSPGPGPSAAPQPLLIGMRNYTVDFDWEAVGRGIYPRETLIELQRIFTFGQRKNGIVSNAAKLSLSHTDDAYSIVNSLSTSDWSRLHTSLWNFLRPLEKFGTYVSAALGIIAIFNAFKYIITAIFRFVRSPDDVGCLRRIALALSGTLFFWWHSVRTPKKTSAPNNDGRIPNMMLPPSDDEFACPDGPPRIAGPPLTSGDTSRRSDAKVQGVRPPPYNYSYEFGVRTE